MSLISEHGIKKQHMLLRQKKSDAQVRTQEKGRGSGNISLNEDYQQTDLPDAETPPIFESGESLSSRQKDKYSIPVKKGFDSVVETAPPKLPLMKIKDKSLLKKPFQKVEEENTFRKSSVSTNKNPKSSRRRVHKFQDYSLSDNGDEQQHLDDLEIKQLRKEIGYSEQKFQRLDSAFSKKTAVLLNPLSTRIGIRRPPEPIKPQSFSIDLRRSKIGHQKVIDERSFVEPDKSRRARHCNNDYRRELRAVKENARKDDKLFRPVLRLHITPNPEFSKSNASPQIDLSLYSNSRDVEIRADGGIFLKGEQKVLDGLDNQATHTKIMDPVETRPGSKPSQYESRMRHDTEGILRDVEDHLNGTDIDRYLATYKPSLPSITGGDSNLQTHSKYPKTQTSSPQAPYPSHPQTPAPTPTPTPPATPTITTP